jgi:hypothetical protein
LTANVGLEFFRGNVFARENAFLLKKTSRRRAGGTKAGHSE